MNTAIRIAAAAIVALAASHASAQQQPDFSKVEVKTTDLGHNTYMLEGAGGNVTVAVGGNGVIMVDSEFAPMHDKLKAAIAALTDQKVKFVINTHYHPDHTGGNAAFAEEGAVIVAHRNVAARLAHPSTPGLNGQIPPPAPKDALPTRMFADKITISIGGRTARVFHIANAHTDGDSYVYFPDANVLATGDMGSSDRYPGIDIRVGGSIDGTIAAADAFLKISNDKTKIVPGHGPLGTKADFRAYRDMLVTARNRVAKLKAAGMSEDQVAAAKPLADIQGARHADDAMSERFVRLVYDSVK